MNVLRRGVHPPWYHDAFPPVLERNFWLCGKFSQFYLFPKNCSIFIRQNFWRPFFLLVIDHKFRFPPYFWIFPLFSLFPPVSEKLLFSLPTFTNSPSCFRKIHVFFTCFTCISFPPTLTMMHLCITQCTCWTPLRHSNVRCYFKVNYYSEVKSYSKVNCCSKVIT